MRKDTSTNAFNEKQINDSCGMAYSLSVIGGRWKPAILCRLLYGKMRYSDLRNSIANISERMLVAQLRELETDQVVKRIVHPVVPPRVEYELTELGLTMKPMLKSMSDWGNMHRSQVQHMEKSIPEDTCLITEEP
ncbi:winged helix-turn-helix transcriptional regulator [Pedobacter heparinus]|uniref:winged helix-turn-helix transcriptional regulator n=1 Tax=Pedobacter heparinus TaxID=984 RepID=UPI00292D4B6A|nr:winged helix-turn-helix transcriptional regulator [Pedobacter heparinus]